MQEHRTGIVVRLIDRLNAKLIAMTEAQKNKCRPPGPRHHCITVALPWPGEEPEWVMLRKPELPSALAWRFAAQAEPETRNLCGNLHELWLNWLRAKCQ
jgi:hypothetical protein